jgi:cold shock CspA family protein
MERGEGVSTSAGCIGGVVRSFVELKAYGFIDGYDGVSYFVHIKDVQGGEALVNGQHVTFVPKPSPKGSKATQVIPGQAPTLIYEEPSTFIVTKFAKPNGVDVVLIVGNGWAESNDPNRAREDLIQLAKSYGGNAIINMQQERYTKQQACSNYKFTMFRQHGEFAVVKVVSSSSDPAVIEAAQQRMQDLNDWWNLRSPPVEEPATEAEPREPASLSTLVPPAKVKFVALMVWSWTCTIGKILWLTGLHFAKKGLAKYRSLQKT